MTGSKFDMRRNPVYQIDCEVTHKGRRFASTKRRVCWRFGFSLLEAIEKGLTGIDCRGEEHEVVLIASLTSGKQRILADGLEVHFARSPVTEKFECSWTMNGGHEIKVVGSPSPGLFVNHTVHRQFDLLIDGLPFEKMPKIFQLGKKRTLGSSHNRILSHVPQTDLAPRPLGIPRRTQSLPEWQTSDLLDLSSDHSSQGYFSTPLGSPTSVKTMESKIPQQMPCIPPMQDPFHQMHTSWPLTVNKPYVTPDSSVSSRSESPLPSNPFASYVDNRQDAQLVPVDQALKSLVNFDNFSHPQNVSRPPLHGNFCLADMSAQSERVLVQNPIMQAQYWDPYNVPTGMVVHQSVPSFAS